MIRFVQDRHSEADSDPVAAATISRQAPQLHIGDEGRLLSCLSRPSPASDAHLL
jgi:hypothetical protein